MTNPIHFSSDGDSLEFTGSRGGFHAKHRPLCLYRWKLYRDGLFLGAYRSFELMTRAAQRFEALEGVKR